MRHRFLIGRAAHRAVAGAHAVIAGRLGQSGLAEMVGQDFRLVRRQFGKALFDRARSALMPFAPASQQQALIGGVAHQRVLETESHAPRRAPPAEESPPQPASPVPLRASAPPRAATASRIANGNCRPTTAAICATSRASPRRSSRAISESLSVAGTAALSSAADSITLLVNSSTNSGTPSVLATIAATVSAVRPCAAAMPATSWAHSARPRRPSVSSVECGRVCQGGAKSGRAVTSASNRAWPMLSVSRVINSSVVASIQWASSRIRQHRVAVAKADDLVDQ